MCCRRRNQWLRLAIPYHRISVRVHLNGGTDPAALKFLEEAVLWLLPFKRDAAVWQLLAQELDVFIVDECTVGDDQGAQLLAPSEVPCTFTG